MTNSNNNQMELAYPICKHQMHSHYESKWVLQAIEDVSKLPYDLLIATKDLSQSQLSTSYRPGGWTLRQVIHHLADSHMNAYCRFKLGLTETIPSIKPYNEALWATLPENETTPVLVSIQLLEALHLRWVNTLSAMHETDFSRNVIHPQYMKSFTLWQLLSLYQWHGKHHVAHITQTIKINGWN